MKKLTILSLLLSISAGLFLVSCAHDEPVTSTTTTTHETTVTQPAAATTTTTTQRRY